MKIKTVEGIKKTMKDVNQNIIEITGLYKSFGEVKAVNGLSFCVKKGELFAFLGVNGAGKSTTISIMTGSLEKDSGSVVVCGQNIDDGFGVIPEKIGVVFQNSVLDGALTVSDNLHSRACLYNLYGEEAENRIADLARLLDFGDLMNRKVGKLSGGQRRRIDVARALINNPELLILDEPTTGLDPQTRKNLWSVVENLRKERGMTVFLTTHYMEEAADADYVVILDSGVMVAHGTPVELKNSYVTDYITVYNADEAKIKSLCETRGLKYEAINGAVRIEVENTVTARDLIISFPDVFADFEIIKGKMDDVFLAVTGKKLGSAN